MCIMACAARRRTRIWRSYEALCLRLEVPLHVHHASVPDRVAASRAAGEPETIEEAARALRYEVFGSLIAEGHADSVLTAHTLDDQAETVLMKLLRGAWTEGLSGIHPVVLEGAGTSGQRTPAARFCGRCSACDGRSWRTTCAGARPALADRLVERGRGVYPQPDPPPFAADAA